MNGLIEVIDGGVLPTPVILAVWTTLAGAIGVIATWFFRQLGAIWATRAVRKRAYMALQIEIKVKLEEYARSNWPKAIPIAICKMKNDPLYLPNAPMAPYRSRTFVKYEHEIFLLDKDIFEPVYRFYELDYSAHVALTYLMSDKLTKIKDPQRRIDTWAAMPDLLREVTASGENASNALGKLAERNRISRFFSRLVSLTLRK